MFPLNHNQASSVDVFYHANCHDGHVAAFTLWLDLRGRDDIRVEFHPVQYGTIPPDVSGKIVYILDFSFPLELINTMIEQAKALLIIDHHITSQENLIDVPDKYKIFNEEESATTLTWKHLYPDKPLPLLYHYIRSYDLHLNDLEDVQAFNLAFELAIRDNKGMYNFEITEKYLNDKEIEGLISVGKLLVVYHNNLVEKSLHKIHFCPIRRENQLLIVAYINTIPQLANDIGIRCMEEYPFVDFCACFYIDPNAQMTQFLLRSKDSRQDVSIIAKDHGGGGHRNASGCRIKGITSRLNYDHLSPWPLWCMYTNKKLRIKRESMDECLTPDYLRLLQLRFPGKVLQIDLDLSD